MLCLRMCDQIKIGDADHNGQADVGPILTDTMKEKNHGE
jgi:hypothetical protein